MGNFKEEKKQSAPAGKETTLNYKLFFATMALVLIFLSQAKAVGAASLRLSPADGSYEINKTFTVNVFVSSADQAMNAVGAVISFPAEKLEVVSLSKAGSIISLWVQEPVFSNSAGSINFEGIVMNPGFTGPSGKIITVNFKAKNSGPAALNFFSGSVLANDGTGTNILAGLAGAKFNITALAAAEPEKEQSVIIPVVPARAAAPEAEVPARADNTPLAPVVVSLTHPDQEKWYADKNPEFEFSLPKGVNGVNVLADKNPATDPGIRSDGLFSSYAYKNVDDGVWYFHVRLRNAYGWGGTSHYRFQIDTEPPAPITIKFSDGKISSQPRVSVTFDTTDALSGIDYYTVEHKDKDSLKISAGMIIPHNPHVLPPLPVGEQQIRVTAFDKAGNSTSAADQFVIKPTIAPEIIDYPREINVNGTLNIQGKTVYPNSDVIIWLQKGNNAPQQQAGQSDADGKFIFSKKEMGNGVYRLWAEIADKKGGRSEPSEKVIIIVKESAIKGFGDWLNNTGSATIKFLTILIPLLALLLLLLLLIWHSWQKFSRLRLKAAKELRSAQKAYQKEIENSKTDIRKRIGILEANRARRRSIDEADKKIIERLKKDLNNMDKAGENEINYPGKALKQL